MLYNRKSIEKFLESQQLDEDVRRLIKTRLFCVIASEKGEFSEIHLEYVLINATRAEAYQRAWEADPRLRGVCADQPPKLKAVS